MRSRLLVIALFSAIGLVGLWGWQAQDRSRVSAERSTPHDANMIISN